jgi:hypothetical protein
LPRDSIESDWAGYEASLGYGVDGRIFSVPLLKPRRTIKSRFRRGRSSSPPSKTTSSKKGAKAVTLVDTGTPTDPNSPVASFSTALAFAGQFTLSGNHTINSVEIFFETRIAGPATLKILSDSSNVPASTLFAQTFNFAVAPAQFVPFSGLSVNLGSGTYWLALFGLDTFNGLALTQPLNPAPFYANTTDGVNWQGPSAGRFAFRISGDEVAQTPLPAALPLFATGLGVLALLGWRRKRMAQTAA